MRYTAHRLFERQAKKLSRDIQAKIWERLELLFAYEFNPLLNNHKLHHPYEGYSSINITGDYRLIYKRIDTNTIYLRAVGTHHQLYGT